VIVATGSELTMPQTPGMKNVSGLSFKEVLKGEVKIKMEKVVVLGGGLIGPETALFLASLGNRFQYRWLQTLGSNIFHILSICEWKSAWL